ncbi:hypothetical protein Tco_1340885, partial [Tanacetum coccineum]
MSINCSLQNEVIRVYLENESLKDEISDLKKALGGRGKRKEKISSKEVIFTKADESLSMSIPEITSDSNSECKTLEPLPPIPKLIGDASTVSPAYVIKRKTKNKSPAVLESCTDNKVDSSTEQLLLTLMEVVKGLKRQIEIPSSTSSSNSQSSSLKSNKQKTWFGPCKHCELRNHLFDDCYSKPKCSTCGSTIHLIKEHLEHAAIKKTLIKLKAQSPLNPTSKKAPMILKPFKECKYYGFNDHHYDNCEYYPGCEVCGSIAHEPADCPKKHRNSRKPRIANKQSTEPIEKYSKESGLKVVFGDDSSGDTEGYGSVNCNGITFTKVSYMNGLKHNLISISQLCDANFKVLFTKTQGTIFN